MIKRLWAVCLLITLLSALLIQVQAAEVKSVYGVVTEENGLETVGAAIKSGSEILIFTKSQVLPLGTQGRFCIGIRQTEPAVLETQTPEGLQIWQADAAAELSRELYPAGIPEKNKAEAVYLVRSSDGTLTEQHTQVSVTAVSVGEAGTELTVSGLTDMASPLGLLLNEKAEAIGVLTGETAAYCSWYTAHSCTLKPGDTVVLGSYEQDNNSKNGKEPIEWLVLDTQGERALVISKYALDVSLFHGKRESVTWETSDLRRWLNETFWDSAFTKAEQSRIRAARTVTSDLVYSSRSTAAAEDKLFCLSKEEAGRYFSADTDRQVELTPYAARSSVTGWWLRSPGAAGDAAKATVSTSGRISTGGSWVTTLNAVRPAMWIIPEK